MALSQVPHPFGIGWQDWVDTLIGFNDSIRPNVPPNLPWQEVAQRLAEFEPAVPRPDWFRTWQDWACALKQAYPN
jgi:hypothetical protein